MQTKYKIYNTQSTISYTNYMIVAGLIVGSLLNHSYDQSDNVSNFILPQYTKVVNQTNFKNQAIQVIENSILQIENADFDFYSISIE